MQVSWSSSETSAQTFYAVLEPTGHFEQQSEWKPAILRVWNVREVEVVFQRAPQLAVQATDPVFVDRDQKWALQHTQHPGS